MLLVMFNESPVTQRVQLPPTKQTPRFSPPLTVTRSMESHIKLLHVVVNERNLIIAHQPVRNNSNKVGWLVTRLRLRSCWRREPNREKGLTWLVWPFMCSRNSSRNREHFTHNFITSVSIRRLGEDMLYQDWYSEQDLISEEKWKSEEER
jgi:hypothetical protein